MDVILVKNVVQNKYLQRYDWCCLSTDRVQMSMCDMVSCAIHFLMLKNDTGNQVTAISICIIDIHSFHIYMDIMTYKGYTVCGRNPGRGKTFSLLHDMQTGSEAHPASYSVGITRVLSQGLSRWGVKLTTHLHLVLRLRISGAIPLLPLHAFSAWTGKTLLFISKAQTKTVFNAYQTP